MTQVDLGQSLHTVLTQTIQHAETLHEQGKTSDAAQYFEKAAQLAKRQLRTSSTNPKRWLEYAQRLENVAKELKSNPAKPIDDSTAHDPPNAQSQGDEELTQRIASLRVEGQHTWDDLVGLDQIARETRMIVRLAAAPNRLKSLQIQPNILLYGPPGTGKSMIASAISKELDQAFYLVNASDLLSKWFGESARLATELYQQARSHKTAVIFIDEIDALCPSREGQASGPERRLLASLLTQMSGVGSSRPGQGHVITLAATNTPWDLDRAVLSRFAKRLYVPLPSSEARRYLINKTLQKIDLTCEGSIDASIEQSDMLSGRQIVSAVNDAAMTMLIKQNPTLANAQPAPQTDEPLRISPLRAEDLSQSFANFKPDVTKELIDQYEKW